jgi:hypothetical protein
MEMSGHFLDFGFIPCVLAGMFVGRKIGWSFSKAVLYTAPMPLTFALCLGWAGLLSFGLHGLIRAFEPGLIATIFAYGAAAYVSIPNYGLFVESSIPVAVQERHSVITMLPFAAFAVSSAVLFFVTPQYNSVSRHFDQRNMGKVYQSPTSNSDNEFLAKYGPRQPARPSQAAPQQPEYAPRDWAQTSNGPTVAPTTWIVNPSQATTIPSQTTFAPSQATSVPLRDQNGALEQRTGQFDGRWSATVGPQGYCKFTSVLVLDVVGSSIVGNATNPFGVFPLTGYVGPDGRGTFKIGKFVGTIRFSSNSFEANYANDCGGRFAMGTRRTTANLN